MENNENFQFFGFPENIEIEIPDEPVNHSSRMNNMGDPMQFMKELSTMTPENLKKMLPQEAIDELNEISGMAGIPFDEMLNGAIETSKTMMNGNMSGIMNMFSQMFGMSPDGCDGDCEDCDCEDDEETLSKYKLGEIDTLLPSHFGSVKCTEDDDLYTHFVDKYGTDSTKYLDPNLGIKESYLTEVTAKLPLGNIKNLKYIDSNRKYILFYAEPDVEDTYGFFVAVVKYNDDFVLYIPEFRNTFNLGDDGSVNLYNIVEDENLFSIDNNGGAVFNQLSISAIQFAINFALAPEKRTLLNVHQFGTIKNTMPSVMNDAMMLKVGMITPHDTPEAVLLRKDAELDMNETAYPLYFNFGKVVPQASLLAIAPIIFRSDLNNCPLLDNCELKYTSDRRLYIDIDFGEF